MARARTKIELPALPPEPTGAPDELASIIDQLDGTPDGKMTIPEELNLLPLREVVIVPVLVALRGPQAEEVTASAAYHAR